CWQFWTARLRHRKPVERVLVRAIDSTWQMQPEQVEWNAKGYMYNAWYGMKIEG
ncbi:MAG: hypothetical protein KDA75_22760, partial [Planctomycetaceae bacterium]|nr:hypothetical protein [Planctomycetaceae bacterium]